MWNKIIIISILVSDNKELNFKDKREVLGILVGDFDILLSG